MALASAHSSFDDGAAVRTFLTRKEAKKHGARILIADDVATAGSSIKKAVEAVRAAEALGEYGVRLLSVFMGGAFR